MTNDFSVPFFIGLTCLFALFSISALIVVGIKLLINRLETLFPRRITATKSEIASRKRTRKKPQAETPAPSPIRSIEIDPNQVDKIYVRKSS